MFASAFREASARALLLPRQRPGQAHAAVAAAPAQRRPAGRGREAPDVPDAARDHARVPARRVRRAGAPRGDDRPALADRRSWSRSTPSARRRSRSRCCSGGSRVYMYEGDAPLAERRAAALSLDRDLLRELLGTEELRELLDPRAIDELELELQWLADGRRARNADDVHDLLRSVGDLTEDEIAARTDGDDAGRGSRPAARGGPRDPGPRGRRGPPRRRRGCRRPARRARRRRSRSGLPGVFTEPTERPLERLVARYARTHGPFVARRGRGAAGRRRRTGSARRWRRSRPRAASRTASSGPAAWSGSGATSTCCGGSASDRSRRSARRSSRSTRPTLGAVPARVAGRRPPARRSPTRSSTRSPGCRARRSPPRSWRPTSCRARVRGYRPADLDALCASGDLVWVGAGPLGADDGRVSLCFRDQARLLASGRRPERPAGGRAPRRDPRTPARRAARRSGRTWCQAAGTADERVAAARALGPGLGRRGHERHAGAAPGVRPRGASREGARARARARGRDPGRSAGPDRPRARDAGRSSLRCVNPAPSPTEVAHARALQLLDRHGVRDARVGPGRGRARRVRRRLPRAEGDGGGRARSAAATSWPGSARRSSRSPARSTGCARSARADAG